MIFKCHQNVLFLQWYFIKNENICHRHEEDKTVEERVAANLCPVPESMFVLLQVLIPIFHFIRPVCSEDENGKAK